MAIWIILIQFLGYLDASKLCWTPMTADLILVYPHSRLPVFEVQTKVCGIYLSLTQKFRNPTFVLLVQQDCQSTARSLSHVFWTGKCPQDKSCHNTLIISIDISLLLDIEKLILYLPDSCHMALHKCFYIFCPVDLVVINDSVSTNDIIYYKQKHSLICTV